MAPAQQARPDKEKRISGIISFASELVTQLPTAVSSRTAASLSQEIHAQISNLSNRRAPTATARSGDLDNCGTNLWNVCTRLRRGFDSESPADVPPILLVARVFAFLLLDFAYDSGNKAAGNFTRLLKVSIKAAKSCLDSNDLDLALVVLEKISFYEEKLEKGDAEVPQDDQEACASLVAEYYVLRTAVAWQKGQFKLAEHMFTKSTDPTRPINTHIAESLSDVLYEMGKGLLERREYQMAITWLDRACSLLDRQEPDKLSTDATELRTSILQATIKALLGSKGPEELTRARNLVANLESEVGGKLIVSMLKLEIISASTESPFDADAYADILRKMTRALSLTENNFNLLLFHIRKLNGFDSRLACCALDELISLRVLPEGPLERIEKVLITRLYLVRAERESEDDFSRLEILFESIAANLSEPLSAAACLGAHTLLWTRIEASYTQRHYDVSERWCNLAMRPMFEKSGEVNMARISRKLLLCAIERDDTNGAGRVFDAMPATSRKEPLTQFLMYKMALRCEKSDIAADCLRNISSSSSEDYNLLYACCLEAQNKGSRSQALAALLLVLEKQVPGAATTVHLPSLARSAIKMLVHMIEGSKLPEGSDELENLVIKLCKLYEQAAESMSKTTTAHQKPSGITWTALELDWFSKNSYNIAVKHLGDWHPRSSLRMISSCIKFIDHYPGDISHQVSEDIALRKMFCEFSGATALLALARGEDHIETQLQDYLELRKCVSVFDSLLENRLETMEEVSANDLVQKLSILITFDFEAACQLKAWDSLGEVVLKAAACKSMKVYQLMADCLLCSQAPTPVIIANMKRIINEAWGLEELDLVRLAKYMRCLFQIALSDIGDVAEQLLDQIQDHTEQASVTETPYPKEELEWIITNAFNHSIDLYCNEKDDDARSWAHKAINLAQFYPDDGQLQKLLQDRLVGLKFNSL